MWRMIPMAMTSSPSCMSTSTTMPMALWWQRKLQNRSIITCRQLSARCTATCLPTMPSSGGKNRMRWYCRHKMFTWMIQLRWNVGLRWDVKMWKLNIGIRTWMRRSAMTMRRRSHLKMLNMIMLPLCLMITLRCTGRKVKSIIPGGCRWIPVGGKL